MTSFQPPWEDDADDDPLLGGAYLPSHQNDWDTAQLPSKTESEQGFNAFFTAANPSGAVSVIAAINGRIHHVDLSSSVTSMTERQLAEEITFLADLAVQKARAAQHAIVAEVMRELGHDRVETRGFLEYTIGLPSPEAVQIQESQTFADRYTSDDD